MAQSKMNVFHFHIVDAPSFPYESRTFPELSDAGAYDSAHVYSQGDLADLIDFARQRGIRIVAEFDSPGSTRCMRKSRIHFSSPTRSYTVMGKSNRCFDTLLQWWTTN